MSSNSEIPLSNNVRHVRAQHKSVAYKWISN